MDQGDWLASSLIAAVALAEPVVEVVVTAETSAGVLVSLASLLSRATGAITVGVSGAALLIVVAHRLTRFRLDGKKG